MNRVLIVEVSESDRRLMSGLLVKHGYEPIAVDNMAAAKECVIDDMSSMDLHFLFAIKKMFYLLRLYF